MQKTLIALVSSVVLFALFLIGAFFYEHGQTAQLATVNIDNLSFGKGSISLDRPSSITENLGLSSALETKPLPTNKWWTGITDVNAPQPVFNLPWSTQITDAGLAAGIPRVSATSNAITAPMTPDITVAPKFSSISRPQVSAFDDMSVSVDALDSSGGTTFSAKLVKGLPFEYIKYSQPLEVNASGDSFAIGQLTDGRHAASVTVNGQSYEMVSSAGSTMQVAGKSITLTPAVQGDQMVLVALPADINASQRAQYLSAAAVQITGTNTSYKIVGQTAVTTLNYDTAGSGKTVHMVLPAQTNAGASTSGSVGSFATIRGTGVDVPGNTISYTDPIPTHYNLALPVPLQDNFFQKSRLETYLEEATTNDSVAPYSYNGGKQLFRLANLLLMAHAIGSPTETTFKRQLYSDLSGWMTYSPGKTDQYLAYDSRVKGIVAVSPEFYNDQFDDHQFQYGYFLYSSAVMGDFDPSFVKNYGKVVDLLADDIANTNPNDPNFPRLRVYDPYEGHSWADGLSQFAAGNDEESVSEAANAWYGLMEWGQVSQNKSMEQTGEWLYANETADSLTYWYNTGNNKAAFPAPFAHHQISDLWSSMGDWSTFFSAAPEAMHIILVMPLSGASLYLNTNNNLKSDLQALQTELAGNSPQNYHDVLMMMQAMANPSLAAGNFKPNVSLDDSNSLAYVYYWSALAEQGKL